MINNFSKDGIIKEINLYRCPVKLKEPFIISLGKLEYADNVIVKIKTSVDVVGFGECSPFQTIHGENGETCMAIGKVIGKVLLNNNAADVAHCLQLMDAVIFGNSCIKSAFDMALHDIASQLAGLPLYKFLGGNIDKEIYTDYTISIGTPEKMASDAEKIIHNGFTIIKVKLGKGLWRDPEELKWHKWG